jgi:biopolymer transport protein ExbD
MEFHCPHCNHPLTADANCAGASIRCTGCQAAVIVPAPVRPSLEKAQDKAPEAEAAKPPEAPVRFTKKREADQEIDMTPMIDCVFQLLIFFLVTAAFAQQKSLEMPTPDRQDKNARARTLEELESDNDLVIIRIDKDNTVWVDDAEAPSEAELFAKLRKAREGKDGKPGPTSLLVLADGEARHDSVVTALDAGNAVGMESVRLATVDEEDF